MAEEYTRKPRRDDEGNPRSNDGGGRPRNQKPPRDSHSGQRRWVDRPKRDDNGSGRSESAERRWSERPPRDGAPRRNASSDNAGRREGAPRRWDDKPQREGDTGPRRWEDRPKRDSNSGRDGAPRKWEDRPRREGDRAPRKWEDRPKRDGDRGPRKFDDRPRRDFGSGDRKPREYSDDRPRRDEPALPEDLQLNELDKGARAELKGLSKENAEAVAGHLIMAARLIDESVELAHKHALAASQRAGRIAVVRETLGITAYLTGDYALALRELRTYRRISGRDDQLPLMVDSERGLGRLDQALSLAREADRDALDPTVRVQLAIAVSGVRLDQGDAAGALRELTIPELDTKRAYSYSPDLYAAYATVLEDLGRTEEAEKWHTLSAVAAEALSEQFDEEMIVIDEYIAIDEELPEQPELPEETGETA